ncbi:MAG TPA: TetR/AcrR family transcriptional regulator [Acidimicrobiia bacterium]|nr:TetR/AcrR family transcriptional regulator [Acidimicrobiia bacterium]
MNPRFFDPGTAAGARTRARRGEGELLRAQILVAAERLLVETGNEDDVSIRSIADAVGVTPPSIYLHFPDKETLLFAVCDRQFARFDEALEAAGATATDPVVALERRAEEYVRFGLEHPEAYRIMFMGRSTLVDRHTDMVEKAGTTAFNHLVAAVQRAIDNGGLRADLDALQGAIFLWTGMHGITSLLISLAAFPWGDRETLVRDLCRLHLRALRSEAGS